MIEGAQQPFGCGRRKPSCPGPGSEEPSAVERGPNNSFLITLKRVIDQNTHTSRQLSNPLLWKLVPLRQKSIFLAAEVA